MDDFPTGAVFGCISVVVLTIGVGMAGCPAYNVYSVENVGVKPNLLRLNKIGKSRSRNQKQNPKQRNLKLMPR